MKIGYQSKDEDIVDALTGMLEQDTGKKIFTLKVLNRVEDGLESIVVFDDKSVLQALISIQTIDGKLACRMQGNWI